jgi:hypothetical protein
MKTFLTALALFSVLILLAQCSSEKKDGELTSSEESKFLEQGKSIASATFTALSGKLTAAIEEKGISGAVEYCNIAAMPLVDSLSKANNATIRRTSLRVRNPENAPNNWERGILADFETKMQNGEEPKPVVKLVDERTVAFAAPIKTLPLCVKCHGEIGTGIVASDYLTIKKLYPEDEAIGFQEGQLRGMWSITFQR